MKRYLLTLLLLTGCRSTSPVIVGPPDVKASVQAALASTQTAQPSSTPYPTYTPFPTVAPAPNVAPVHELGTAAAEVATLEAQVAALEAHSIQQDTFLSYIATSVGALVLERQAAVISQTLTPTPAVMNGWVTYSNEAYKLSLQVPQAMSAPDVAGEAPYFVFGEQITLLIAPADPNKQSHRAQVNERVDRVTIAGVAARRAQGHINSSDGRIPQQFVQYVVQHGELYYTFTLYALSVNQKSGAKNVIHPLKTDDVALFEQIMQTVSFTD